jgi:hypothetical protein
MKSVEKENCIGNRDEFREIAEDIMESAVKELEETGTVSPKFFFFTEDGKMYGVSIPFADDQDKPRVRAEVAVLAKKLEAKRLIFLSDVFVGDIDGPPPSEAPKRKEAISLLGEDGNDTFHILQEYRRKRKGKRIKMGKRVETDNTTGLFTGILEDQHVTESGKRTGARSLPIDQLF